MENNDFWDELVKKNRLTTKEQQQIMKEEMVLFYFDIVAEEKNINEILNDDNTKNYLRKIGYENFTQDDLLEIINNKTNRDFSTQNKEHSKKR